MNSVNIACENLLNDEVFVSDHRSFKVSMTDWKQLLLTLLTN